MGCLVGRFIGEVNVVTSWFQGNLVNYANTVWILRSICEKQWNLQLSNKYQNLYESICYVGRWWHFMGVRTMPNSSARMRACGAICFLAPGVPWNQSKGRPAGEPNSAKPSWRPSLRCIAPSNRGACSISKSISFLCVNPEYSKTIYSKPYLWWI